MSIKRLHTNDRMSQAVVHNDTVYLAGQVGKPGENVTQQTETILGQVDSLLAECGSDKTKVLQAVIWLSDMSYFAEMNAVWDTWVSPGNCPARAAGEAKLATPDYDVEIIIVAAAD
ncbi:MAG: RidA family protein [Rhodospirillales bacterium]|jgi:enamine deaminase RidA (YjgF/YER057c/UK114 family)|nr:RidA family protein [Rhodospirillales bacterium]